jgi:hypothetical protein
MKKLHEEFEKSSTRIKEDFRLKVKILKDKGKLKLAYMFTLNKHILGRFIVIDEKET